MRAKQFIEAALGINPKRPAREGSRPARGHEPVARYNTQEASRPNPLDIPNPDDVHKPMKGDEPVKRGDIVWAQDPFNIAQVHTAKVKRIGRTMVFLVLKNGEELAVPHDEVSKSYDMLSKRAHRILDKKGKFVGNYKVSEEHEDKYEERRRGKSPSELGGADAWYHRNPGPDYYGYEKGSPEAAEYIKAYQEWDEGPSGGKQWDESMEEAMARMEAELLEHGKASRELCKSSKPDADLGASMLASCKSQGLRARDGNKSHKLGKSPKSRVKVGGHRIKGQKYGGPLPDWS